MFVINYEKYSELNEDYLRDDKNIKDDMLSDIEKEGLIKTKNDFIMFFDFIKYSFDEIVEKIDSQNNYTRSLGLYLLNKIIGNAPELKKMLPILFQIDISNLTLIDFYKYMKKVNSPIDFRQIIYDCNHNIKKDTKNIVINTKIEKYTLNNFNSTKIYKKFNIIFNALTRKLGLRETFFTNLITYSDSLNNIFNSCPELIEEYISSNNENSKLCLEAIKALYYNILISYFFYC